MTNLTVTGAAGYLGGTVVTSAAESSSFSVRTVTRTAASWLPGENVPVKDLVAEARRAVAGADVVVHLAGSNEVAAKADPDGSLAETVAASRAVAEACSRERVARLVYVSTVHVYGSALAEGATVDEETLPHPLNAYAISRLASEFLIEASAGPTEVVVFRLTNGIGPPADPSVRRWSLVANDLCRQAANGGPVRLLTSGRQWRDFISLSDVSRAILAAAASPAQVRPGTYNLGSGRSITVRALADMVAQEASRAGLGPIRVEVTEDGTAESKPYTVDVGRLAACGIKPGEELSTALAGTIAFCLANRATIDRS